MGFLTFLRENWLFLTAGVLLTFTSGFGQTFFISIFAGQIMDGYDLSHGQWGLLYTLATTASAIAMIWAGALTDRFRIRALNIVVALSLAAACLGMAVGHGVWMLVLVIFALRFTGQGMMSHLAIVAMARWFVATRGQALSVASMGFALGQAILPLAFVALMAVFDWRWLWVLAAGLVVLSMPIIHQLLKAERTPQSVSETTSALGMAAQHWTRAGMLRHWLFWAMIPLMLGPPAWGTALFFHQVHMTEVKGWELVEFVALLPLYTATSITSTFATGALIDRIGTSRLMQLYLVPFSLAFFILAQSDTLMSAAVAMMILGVGTGAQATVPNAFWAEYYGTRHLGAIKALAAAVMVFGSAIGPGITAVFIDEGIDFPMQMLAISAYFGFAGVITILAIGRARTTLAVAPEIDVIRT